MNSIHKLPNKHQSNDGSLEIYTLRNSNGIEIEVINYGAIITSIRTPDKHGHLGEIALGFDSPDEYFKDDYKKNCPYFGAVVGRYANRIAGGKFILDGITYKLATNNLGNTLHGGIKGFDKQFWKGKKLSNDETESIELTHNSSHLDEGFPGNLTVKVIYSLNNQNELHIKFSARTDQPTVINLTNHSYFNLNADESLVTDHHLWINSNQIIETKELIPTGKLKTTAGKAFDFTRSKIIGKDIASLSIGYDTSFALETEKEQINLAARLISNNSGRMLEVFTDQPSVHVYTGFFIPEVIGHGGIKYGKFKGVALETQHYPDSPNHPHFPSTILRTGEQFSSNTVYKFGVVHT